MEAPRPAADGGSVCRLGAVARGEVALGLRSASRDASNGDAACVRACVRACVHQDASNGEMARCTFPSL